MSQIKQLIRLKQQGYAINGYNVDVDPCAGHTDPSIKAFFSPTDDLTILLLFS
ncbi:hypothetical protein [Sphingobacterium sp.]|uniref:hypothetical protein n=1 Tax=Sphingobacterium sp. TaxID=341027 RepID=UPI00289ABD60|nr:hypothetical protein [Sphingobacterium sp.]